MSTEHMRYLQGVLDSDKKALEVKESIYNGSWKKREGIGAFFVTVRKWDALENILEKLYGYDVFKGALEQGDGDGTVLDQIRDMRRYLALIESEVLRLRIERGTLQGTAAAKILDTPLGGVYKAPGDVPQTGNKPRRIPHTAEYRGESIHKMGLHTGSVYRCFNISEHDQNIYIRNAYNEMIWCDASQFQLTYGEGEDE